MGWLSSSLSHAQGSRALAASAASLVCTAWVLRPPTTAISDELKVVDHNVPVGGFVVQPVMSETTTHDAIEVVVMACYFSTHSLVLLSSCWLSLLAFCSLFSSLYSMSITYRPTRTFSFGLARVPVLAVFSTTVLAQLFSVFLTKESFEHILSPDHHGSGHDAGHDSSHDETHDAGPALPYFVAALASSISLLLAVYSLKNQPFQHVLTSSASSSVQEHAADMCQAICWVVPGLSRLLLPRINCMVLLATISSTLIVVAEHFRHEFGWADPVCCLILSAVIFSSMFPLSTYTGRILLQTAPPYLLNDLDRYLAEASHIEGVLELRSAHFWQLDFMSMAGTVDVRVRRDADEQKVLASVTDKLCSLVPKLTVQVVKDATWQPLDAPSWAPTPYPSEHVQYNNHGDHGHSHDDHHGHSHDDHGHSHGGGHGHSHGEGQHAHSH